MILFFCICSSSYIIFTIIIFQHVIILLNILYLGTFDQIEKDHEYISEQKAHLSWVLCFSSDVFLFHIFFSDVSCIPKQTELAVSPSFGCFEPWLDVYKLCCPCNPIHGIFIFVLMKSQLIGCYNSQFFPFQPIEQ